MLIQRALQTGLAVLSILFFANTNAIAQPLGKTHRSVESLISASQFVAIGSIRSVIENIIVKPGTRNRYGIRDERGKFEYVIETQFDEILKNIKPDEDCQQFALFKTTDHNAARNQQLEVWAENKTTGVWLIRPKLESEEFHRWDFLPLDGDRGVSHFGYRSHSLQAPMFAKDLSILATKEQILEKIRQYSPVSQKEHDPKQPCVASIRVPRDVLGEILPGDFNDLILPYDSDLPVLARRLITSPKSFISRNKASKEQYALDQLCRSGIQLLGQMKTEASIEWLEKCLDESVLPFGHSKQPSRIRTEAYERLLDWQVNPPRPDFSDDIKYLSLGYSGITDESLALVAEHKNLESLILWETNISHEGIQHLAGLKRLKQISFSDHSLNDAILRTLRKQNQLHLISQAIIANSIQRPSSDDEVTALRFWCASFTDEGLKEFLCFKNLNVIDLGRMEITDAGLGYLSQFQNLKKIRIRETRVTDEGVESLRKALKNCTIDHK